MVLKLILVAVFTDAEPVFFFFSRKIIVLAKLVFISLVLFQFGCFTLSVEASEQFTPKYVF